MKLLFVADPLEGFKTYKDSTFAMMREAASRGHELMACGPQDIMWQRGGRVTAYVREITLTGNSCGACCLATNQSCASPVSVISRT